MCQNDDPMNKHGNQQAQGNRSQTPGREDLAGKGAQGQNDQPGRDESEEDMDGNRTPGRRGQGSSQNQGSKGKFAGEDVNAD